MVMGFSKCNVCWRTEELVILVREAVYLGDRMVLG